MLYFTDVSHDDAVRYFDHVVARHHMRLVDLAHRMAATGGPLEQMDGSPESTVLLWEWFTAQLDAGLPGVSVSSQPDAFRFLRREWIPKSPALYASEELAHYLFAAVALAEPTTRWELFEGVTRGNVVDRYANVTGIVAKPGLNHPAEENTRGFTARYLDGETFPPQRLKLLYEAALGVPFGSSKGRPGPSILSALVLEPLVPSGDLRRLPPVAEVDDHDAQPVISESGRAVTAEAVLQGAGVTGEPSESWPSLSWRPVVASLNALGAKSANASMPPGREVIDGVHEYELGQREALVTTYGVKHRLRGISVEALEANGTQWQRIDDEMARLAASLDADWKHDG